MAAINVEKKQLIEIINQLKSVGASLDSFYFILGVDEKNEEDKELIEVENLLCSSIDKLKRIVRTQPTS